MAVSEQHPSEPVRAPQPEARTIVRRVNPAPLAFGAFAGTTFLLSWVNTGEVKAPLIGSALATAWVFGGVIQILVAFWHLRNEELFPAVTFGSFGAFWLSFALFGTVYLDKIPASARGAATALFLVPWAIFVFYMLIASLRVNVAVAIALLLAEATLIALIVGQATTSQNLIKLGGWVGVALAIVVWYIAAAEMINHQFARTLLPLGDLSLSTQRQEFPALT